jgi:hypothetical protein
MSDLVEELRQGSLNSDDYRWKAAAEIERLRAEVEELKSECAERDWLFNEGGKESVAAIEQELTALRATNERLRAALDVVRASGLLIGSTTLYDRVRAVVHAALEERTWEKTADAAIDLIRAETLEAAARVADEKEDEWTVQWRAGLKADGHLEGKGDGACEIAAAIRALKGEP